MTTGPAGGPWHRAYSQHVLAEDHAYAAQHLHTTFLDALTAHVRCVAALPVAQGHLETLTELEAALLRERERPAPAYQDGVPDLYFGIQRRLEADVGSRTMSWLRLGLSRNDLDMTVYVMFARMRLLELARALASLQEALLDQADSHLETIIIARTHHQPAQPTTLAHFLAACASVVDRDHDRLLGVLRRLDRCPLGAAALAGSSHPLDRARAASSLGFASAVENTYDAVAASDWQVEMAALVQTVAVGLSRLVHDLLDAAEAGLLRLPDGLVQGSSIMPQKRNPVALEHARTRLSRAAGASQQLAFASHNVPFGDLNDCANDLQAPLHALMRDMMAGLDLLIAAVANSTWEQQKLSDEAARSDTTATELADELVRVAGLSFSDAHHVAASLVARMASLRRPMQEATSRDLEDVGGPRLGEDALREALSPRAFVARRSGRGGPAPPAVKPHLSGLRERLSQFREVVEGTTTRIEGALRELRAPGKDGSA